jgi:tRNA(Ile)-lysidine synthase
LRYHGAVHSPAQRVLSHIRQHELLHPGDRVGIAVSGGIDSVALLRLLLELRRELGIVLSVVHFNHKLRGAESDADEQFVRNLARQYGLELVCDSDDVAGHASDEGVSVEAAARELRYGFFRHLIREHGAEDLEVKMPTLGLQSADEQRRGATMRLDKVVTGHTLDDQAETVLMRIIRGAGLRGLGGIYPRIPVEDDKGNVCGEIVRPLIRLRRRELEQYLRDIGQEWREDTTNADDRFTRNRVRKLILPLLEREFNPAVAENLAELAEIARGEEDYWDNELSGWMGTGVHWLEPEWARTSRRSGELVQIVSAKSLSNAGFSSHAGETSLPDTEQDVRARIEHAPWLVMNASVDRLWFLGEPLAVQRRVVKAVGEHAGVPLEFKHVEEIVQFAAEEGSGKELSLPLGWKLLRHPDELLFVTPDLREPAPEKDYDYELSICGVVTVPELRLVLEICRVPASQEPGYNPDHLLDPDSLPGPLRVRNWRAGDRFWPAHTKSPKKIKELLQERHVAQPQRRFWPLITSGNEIVWLRGFPVPKQFQGKPGCEAIRISERPLGEATDL